MNPVNATALYVSASRSVLQCDPRDPRALAELCKLLPFFRQSLSCLVCGNLLQDPIAPTDSSCQHYVCRGCKGRRMQLKPSCSWCKDYSRFRENRQLSLLVHCYRKLCLYIARSPLATHIAAAAGDSPDLQAVLDEGLSLAEDERPDDAEVAVVAAAAAAAAGGAVDPTAGQSQDASAPEAGRTGVEEEEEEESVAAAAAAMGAAEEEGEESSSAGVNGLHRCNGLGEVVEEEGRLQTVAMETGGGAGGGGAALKQEAFGDELPMCVSLTASGEAGLCDITAFGEDLKHDGGGGGGGALLLSVEEVLRTLDTGPAPSLLPVPLPVPSSTPPDPAPPPPPDRASPSVPQPGSNGPRCLAGPDSSRLPPSLPPEDCPRPPPPPLPVAPRAPPPRCHRKRSRSESDSEKLQPLPISSLLHSPLLGPSGSPPHPHGPGGPTPTAAAPTTTTTTTTTTKREPKFPHAAHHHPLPHLAPVPNGGPPKVGKTVLVSSKGLKKTVEHHGVPKKAYSKARQGAPKPRPQPRDRLPGPHPHAHPIAHPPSPSKPLYKKPVEKKGCKCGRATQNPSVLTCRGQRCPCYSNRKACLDCICRGCQNSYMANGEKKLEAFAVPEKALEQTRLTLGINLTSIAAAALRSPASSAPGNTLINVTTATGTPVTAAFLSGAGHDNRVFDDSLEMRFDC